MVDMIDITATATIKSVILNPEWLKYLETNIFCTVFILFIYLLYSNGVVFLITLKVLFDKNS